MGIFKSCCLLCFSLFLSDVLPPTCPLSDMLFLQGSEVIFKVALSLLGSHKPLILQHESLESIVDFIKTTLPNLGLVQMEKTINQVRITNSNTMQRDLLWILLIVNMGIIVKCLNRVLSYC